MTYAIRFSKCALVSSVVKAFRPFLACVLNDSRISFFCRHRGTRIRRIIVRISARDLAASLLALSFITCSAFAGDTIPKAAWKRGIGQPLENAGGRKPALASSGMIDDGYWQGAPVGGFGAGTFSRTYRGDFS